MGDTYSDRIERLLYARTDEKEAVRAALVRAFAGRSLRHALDVGAGPGLVTEPLAKASEHLTIVEVDGSYEKALREKFPNAHVAIQSITQFPLEKYDFILASQTLYYHPEPAWFPLCRRLFESLRPGGTLALVMNRDDGDWWDLLVEFRARLGEHARFHYIAWSAFTRELATLGTVSEEKLHATLTFESEAELAQFIGRQTLQIYDEAVLAREAPALTSAARRFTEKHGVPRVVARTSLTLLSR